MMLAFDLTAVALLWAAPMIHAWYTRKKGWPLGIALFPPAGVVYWIKLARETTKDRPAAPR